MKDLSNIISGNAQREGPYGLQGEKVNFVGMISAREKAPKHPFRNDQLGQGEG